MLQIINTAADIKDAIEQINRIINVLIYI